MSAAPWIKFYPSDWLAGTRGLTAAETGIYITLIAMMYERCSPLSDDRTRLARLCGCPAGAFTRCLDALIEAGKIIVTEDGLWNERVGKEASNRDILTQKRSDAATQKWKKHRKKTVKNQQAEDANAMQTLCKTDAIPDTRSQKSDKKEYNGRSNDATDDAFERFWKAYPSRGDSPNPKKPCRAKFAAAVKSGTDPEAIIRGAARYADKMAGEPNRALVCQAQTFLSQARWEQYADAPVPIPPRDQQREQWRQRLIGYRDKRIWLGSWGAPPGDRYCDAPADLVAQIVNPKEMAA